MYGNGQRQGNFVQKQKYRVACFNILKIKASLNANVLVITADNLSDIKSDRGKTV